MSLSKKVWVPIAVAAASLVGAFLIVATAPSVEHVEPKQNVPAVRTIAANTETIRYRVRSQGTVAPRTEADLIPEVSGRVVWRSPSLASGGFFEEGEVLLRLERRDFELALNRQRAAVRRAASEREFANSELERRERLSEAGVASPSQLSEARRTASVAEANWLDARSAREQAARDLERSEIKAPFAGRVRDESVDVGQFVGRGSVIARIYATDYAEVRLPIPDRQLAFLDLPVVPRAGDTSSKAPEVILRSRFAGKPHEWRGRIVRTEGEIDARSRMINVVARVEDPYAVAASDRRPPLAVGLFVEAEILGPEVENVVVVPRFAMRDEKTILIVDAEDRLRNRSVEVLRIDRDEVLVKGPLGAGERICVSPLQVVVEGMPVEVIEEASEAARAGDERNGDGIEDAPEAKMQPRAKAQATAASVEKS